MRIKEELKDVFAVFIIMLTGFLFLSFFKIKHSMTFINLDELLWMYRSRFFIDNILSFDFSNLIQSSQPGIMVMWLAGPFMKIVNWDFNFIKDFIKGFENNNLPYNIINDHSQNQQLYSSYKEISFLFNIPILAVIFIFIASLYYLLKKLDFKKWAVVFSLLLIVTTPYYIYFTTPTDKLAGVFSTLSILSLLVYASRKGGKRFLILSAILCSWTALTKLSALFLVPFSLFVLAVYKSGSARFNVGTRQCLVPTTSFSSQVLYFKSIIKDYIQWLAIFFATSVIFLPTIITNPNSVWEFFAKENLQRSIAQSSDVFLFLKIAAAYLSDSSMLSFNLFTMIVFTAFLFLIIQKIKGRMKIEREGEITILFSYVFLFFVFIVSFSKTYSFRYLTPILIVFQVLAGIGICEFSKIVTNKIKFLKKDEVYWWALAFILISQGLLIYYCEIRKIEDFPNF